MNYKNNNCIITKFYLSNLKEYHIVLQDEFMISDRVALQLAGLQAQVVLGAYEAGKGQRYREVEQYLCKRILNAPGRDWSEEVASAHKVVTAKQYITITRLCNKLLFLTPVKIVIFR